MATINEIQEKIKQFTAKNNLDTDPSSRALDIMSELGEVAKEILKQTNYGKQEAKQTKEIESELGDLLFSLTCLANTYNIDLDKALNKVLDKYEKRLEKGSAGSEVE